MASPKIGDQNIEFGSQKDGLNIHTHTHTVYSVYSEQTGEEEKKKNCHPNWWFGKFFSLIIVVRQFSFFIFISIQKRKKSKRRDSKCPPRKAKKKICQTKSLLCCCCCCCLDLDFFFVEVTISLIHFQQKIIDVFSLMFFSSSIFPNHQSSYFLYCFACHRTRKPNKREKKAGNPKSHLIICHFFGRSVGRSVDWINLIFEIKNSKDYWIMMIFVFAFGFLDSSMVNIH